MVISTAKFREKDSFIEILIIVYSETITNRISAIRLHIYCRVCLHTHVASGDMRKRAMKTVIRRIFGSAKNCGSFVGTLTSKANISIWYYLVPYRLSTDSKTRP